MKLLLSEGHPDYHKYYFPYQVMAIRQDEPCEDLYLKGFLPFRSIRNLYYAARSTRVDLSGFELSSENRRVLRKFEEYKLNVIPLSEFVLSDELIKMAKTFVSGVFGKGKKLSETGLKRIVSSHGNYNKVALFKDIKSEDIVGFCVMYVGENTVHYAHPFYKTDLIKKSFGIGMLTSLVNWAHEGAAKYIYLGTCYGDKSLYKTQFSGFEFFDGIDWNGDLFQLKYLVSQEKDTFEGYLFQDETYLSKYYGVKSISRLITKLRHDK